MFDQLLGAEYVGRNDVPTIVDLESAVQRAGFGVDVRIVDNYRAA
jgi:hypothetical protein